MNRQRAKTKKTYVRLALTIVIPVVLVTALYFAVKQFSPQMPGVSGTVADAGQTDQKNRDIVYVKGERYVRRDNMTTLLLIGTDVVGTQESSGSYNNNAQADFLMLLVLDRTEKRCSLIHLNRDTMSDIPVLGVDGKNAGTRYAQLALAHTYGEGLQDSCQNTADAVSNLLYGVRIDRYFCITMDAVATINDFFGGVEVTVVDDFTNIDNTLVQGQTICLNGTQALNYIRARGGMTDSTNLARMARQQTYLQALGSQFIKTYTVDSSCVADLYGDIAEQMVTNCSIQEIDNIADSFCAYESETYSPNGEAKLGDTYMEFYPDEDNLRSLVIDLFYHKE